MKIGDCAIKAMSVVTGLPWDEIFEASKNRFTKYGLTPIDEYRILESLGWKTETYSPLYPKWNSVKMKLEPFTVRRAEQYLQENDPMVKIICNIQLYGMPHAIAYADGQFHNVLEAYKARISLPVKVFRI